MIVFDSIAGSPYFYESAKKVMQQLLPDEPIRLIPLDSLRPIHLEDGGQRTARNVAGGRKRNLHLPWQKLLLPCPVCLLRGCPSQRQLGNGNSRA